MKPGGFGKGRKEQARSVAIVGGIILLAPLLPFLAISLTRSRAPREEAPSPAAIVDAQKLKAQPQTGRPGGVLGARKQAAERQQTAAATPAAPAFQPPTCLETTAVSVGREGVAVLAAPGPSAKPTLDLRGHPRLLDPRSALRILEEKARWSRVAVLAPDWPPGASGWEGWIETKEIQRPKTEDEKKCFFVDLATWKEAPASARAGMRETALRILAEDPRCRRIAGGGFLGAGQRFYFTCYPDDGARPYHYWSSAMTRDRSFRPPPLPDEKTAVDLCKKELALTNRRRATIERTDPEAMRVVSVEIDAADSVRRFSFTYAVGDGAQGKAYCTVPPGGSAEIELTGP